MASMGNTSTNGQGVCSPRHMSAQEIEIMKAAVLRRRACINELHFTYTHLLRMLPNLMRRMPETVVLLFHDQFFRTGVLLQRLTLVSNGHGQPPQPSLCAEAATLLDKLFHADRSRTPKTIPGLRTVEALMAVHAHLTHEWGKLVDTLPDDLLPEFHAEAMDMQRNEMDQYHELAELQKSMLRALAAPAKIRGRNIRERGGESATA